LIFLPGFVLEAKINPAAHSELVEEEDWMNSEFAPRTQREDTGLTLSPLSAQIF